MSAETKTTRIPMLERNEVSSEIGILYDELMAQRGVVPNMFKTVAHTPELAAGIAAFLKPLMGDGALPGWYKELIATRIAILQNCDYWISAHSASAKQKGASSGQIDGARDPENGPFTEREKLGFRFADRVHRSALEIDDAFYESLERAFADKEIIELAAVASAYEFFTRFVDSLRIPTTPPP